MVQNIEVLTEAKSTDMACAPECQSLIKGQRKRKHLDTVKALNRFAWKNGNVEKPSPTSASSALGFVERLTQSRPNN